MHVNKRFEVRIVADRGHEKAVSERVGADIEGEEAGMAVTLGFALGQAVRGVLLADDGDYLLAAIFAQAIEAATPFVVDERLYEKDSDRAVARFVAAARTFARERDRLKGC